MKVQINEYGPEGYLLEPYPAFIMLDDDIDAQPTLDPGYWHTLGLSKEKLHLKEQVLEYLDRQGAKVFKEGPAPVIGLGAWHVIYTVEDPAQRARAAEVARTGAWRQVPNPRDLYVGRRSFGRG